MVYVRSKVVKGEKYLYLVKSVWDAKKNTSRQETVKYLGKVSEITRDDIPPEYRNNPKITSFLSSEESLPMADKERLIQKLRQQFYRCLIKADFDGCKNLYEDYSSKSGHVSFFERILNPVMYQIGDDWENGRISVAEEHVASNISNTLVRIIRDKNAEPPRKMKIVICTPEGEEHVLGPLVLETHIASLGHKVYNLTAQAPHNSITSFIEANKPDAVFVSVTLPDSIKPAQRLVRKIRQLSETSIFVGGQALQNQPSLDFGDAQIVVESSLKDIPKLLTRKMSVRTK
ncbi:MAG TPA: B12-binding domain-containing protein [Candidatus Nitrosotenuis sp.]|nr:B12-binding domain-containing protein [Candidatus Nitrosotenuis sp.]